MTTARPRSCENFSLPQRAFWRRRKRNRSLSLNSVQVLLVCGWAGSSNARGGPTSAGQLPKGRLQHKAQSKAEEPSTTMSQWSGDGLVMDCERQPACERVLPSYEEVLGRKILPAGAGWSVSLVPHKDQRPRLSGCRGRQIAAGEPERRHSLTHSLGKDRREHALVPVSRRRRRESWRGGAIAFERATLSIGLAPTYVHSEG